MFKLKIKIYQTETAWQIQNDWLKTGMRRDGKCCLALNLACVTNFPEFSALEQSFLGHLRQVDAQQSPVLVESKDVFTLQVDLIPIFSGFIVQIITVTRDKKAPVSRKNGDNGHIVLNMNRDVQSHSERNIKTEFIPHLVGNESDEF